MKNYSVRYIVGGFDVKRTGSKIVQYYYYYYYISMCRRRICGDPHAWDSVNFRRTSPMKDVKERKKIYNITSSREQNKTVTWRARHAVRLRRVDRWNYLIHYIFIIIILLLYTLYKTVHTHTHTIIIIMTASVLLGC